VLPSTVSDSDSDDYNRILINNYPLFKMNGEAMDINQKRTLILRNLQEVLGEDRLDAILKERDLEV